jgi:hypothetical protein
VFWDWYAPAAQVSPRKALFLSPVSRSAIRIGRRWPRLPRAISNASSNDSPRISATLAMSESLIPLSASMRASFAEMLFYRFQVPLGRFRLGLLEFGHQLVEGDLVGVVIRRLRADFLLHIFERRGVIVNAIALKELGRRGKDVCTLER